MRLALSFVLLAATAHAQIDLNPRDAILYDRSEFRIRFSPIGSIQSSSPFRIVGITFEGAVADTKFWTYTTNGAGAAAGQATGVATMSSGTANSGYGQLTSVQSGRFMFAHPHLWRGAILVDDTTVAESTRRWGAFTVSTATPQDGHYFELDEAGVLSVVSVKGGTPTKIASGSFNGDMASYTVDTNVHAYEIVFFTMGVWFFIDEVLIMECLPTTAPWTNILTVPITVTAVNSAAGTTSANVEAWNASLMRLGRSKTESVSYHHAVGLDAGQVLKRTAGTLHSISIHEVSNNAVMPSWASRSRSRTSQPSRPDP